MSTIGQHFLPKSGAGARRIDRFRSRASFPGVDQKPSAPGKTAAGTNCRAGRRPPVGLSALPILSRGALLALTLFACGFSAPPPGLEELTEFGTNPGNLKAYVHAPENRPAGAALVVVLHGCAQDAAEIARLGGWNELADRFGFVVLYPEQARTNNIQACFNWFVPEDVGRVGGEVESIHQMATAARTRYGLDGGRMFITGISAGGAMTAAVLAAYPDEFAAGAVQSGVPAGAAADLATGLAAMQGRVDQLPAEWRQVAVDRYPAYTGAYPRLLILHGLDDPIVKVANARELTEQWTALHGLSPEEAQITPAFEGNARVTRSAWPAADGSEPVLRYDIDSLGHAIAVDPGNGPRQGGHTDRFARDVDFFSSFWIAVFFGLFTP